MLLFEFLFTFLKGILIGMLVSAPMGPTGLLCLRETTRGGRRQGMLVGLGATLSDLVYGLIAYWGVGIVLNLLDRLLCYPPNEASNAEGRRRACTSPSTEVGL